MFKLMVKKIMAILCSHMMKEVSIFLSCRYLGSTSYSCSNQCDVELGNGDKEMVSGFQNPHLLR